MYMYNTYTYTVRHDSADRRSKASCHATTHQPQPMECKTHKNYKTFGTSNKEKEEVVVVQPQRQH
jgi:hypothetical protein